MSGSLVSQILVDADAAARTDLQAGVDRQLILRPHADAQNHQRGRQSLARFQPDDQAFGRRLKTLGRIAQQQA